MKGAPCAPCAARYALYTRFTLQNRQRLTKGVKLIRTGLCSDCGTANSNRLSYLEINLAQCNQFPPERQPNPSHIFTCNLGMRASAKLGHSAPRKRGAAAE